MQAGMKTENILPLYQVARYNMNQDLFTIPNGEIVSRAEVNKHHVFFPSYEYQNRLDRRMRNLGLFVIRMHLPVHNELHANVPPPPQISHDLKHIIIQRNEVIDKAAPQADRIEMMVSHLMRLSHDTGNLQMQEESDVLYHNFIEQLDYIHEGKVQCTR